VQSTRLTRRALAARVASLPFALPLALAAIPRSFSADAAGVSATAGNGLSHEAWAIHQEMAFAAGPRRVYEALTGTQQFDAITRLSDGGALLKAEGAKPTAIQGEVGGTFTLFGGYVTGRHLEMIPDQRLVQAWRAGSWKPGEFSIAAFTLIPDGAKTKLLFEHRGFPDGEGASLAKGWYLHYWQPLAKFLAQG
jgi:activator of HSP90 ATPase